MKHYIYILSNPATGEIFYVGCTNGLERRYREHKYKHIKSCAKRGRSLTPKDVYILSAQTNPVFHLIEEVFRGQEVALQRERFWISFLLHHRFPLVNDPRQFVSGMDYLISDLPFFFLPKEITFDHREHKQAA